MNSFSKAVITKCFLFLLPQIRSTRSKPVASKSSTMVFFLYMQKQVKQTFKAIREKLTYPPFGGLTNTRQLKRKSNKILISLMQNQLKVIWVERKLHKQYQKKNMKKGYPFGYSNLKYAHSCWVSFHK